MSARLINRRELRKILMAESAGWGLGQQRFSSQILDEIEESFRRFLKAQAAQRLPKRRTIE